ncbi:TPA: hypothetical protein EYN23_10250 [Candidatus Poribacteria bacterium]|nr:hypothetical protein [Candidatus Poribacteria bacterium]
MEDRQRAHQWVQKTYRLGGERLAGMRFQDLKGCSNFKDYLEQKIDEPRSKDSKPATGIYVQYSRDN